MTPEREDDRSVEADDDSAVDRAVEATAFDSDDQTMTEKVKRIAHSLLDEIWPNEFVDTAHWEEVDLKFGVVFYIWNVLEEGGGWSQLVQSTAAHADLEAIAEERPDVAGLVRELAGHFANAPLRA